MRCRNIARNTIPSFRFCIFSTKGNSAEEEEYLGAAKAMSIGAEGFNDPRHTPRQRDEALTPLQAADLLAFEFCAEKRREANRPRGIQSLRSPVS